MRNIDELVLTVFAATVIASPLAELLPLLAPPEAHGLFRAFAEPFLGAE